jgi:hypothetical protein
MKDSVIGDLIEQYQDGRSRFWYWRQALIILALKGGPAMRSSPALVRSVYWPTAVAAAIVGLSGVATMLNGSSDSYLLGVGAFIIFTSLLVSFYLWRTREARVIAASKHP